MGILELDYSQTQIKPFLLRPELTPGESLPSFLYRISMENGVSIDCYLEINNLKRCEVINGEFTENSLILLAKLLNRDKNQLFHLSMNKFKIMLGSEHYSDVVMKNAIKYCPLCISEVRYHKWLWSFHPISMCLEHSCFLVDRCHNCKKRLSLSNLMENNCSCGFILDKCNIDEVEGKSVCFRSQELLCNLFESGQENSEVTIKDYLYLAKHSFYILEGMRSFVSHEKVINCYHNKKGSIHDNNKYAELFSNVFWMYEQYPKNLFTVLDQFNKQKPIHSRIEQRIQFENLFYDRKFDWIKKEYDSYWIKKSDRGEIRRDFSVFKRDKKLLLRREFLRKEELKTKKRITSQKFTRILKKYDVSVNKHNDLRKVTTINKDSIEKALQQYGRMLTRQQTADILGIQRESIKGLILAGFLNLDFALDQAGLINISEINKLLRLCRGEVRAPTDEYVSFQKALIQHTINGLRIVDLLIFIKKRNLKPILSIPCGNLANVYLNKQELQSCIYTMKCRRQEKEGFYFTEVIEYLKIGEKTLHEFIKQGVLLPRKVIVQKSGKKLYLFNKQEVESFYQNNYSIVAMAKKLGISIYKLRKWLDTGKITDQTKGLSKVQLLNLNEVKVIIQREQKDSELN
ncbi:TniQ family protein [Paenibacillus alginolyticus]|uniref:TniQ family protein n=1 Tax=Paenibacillus alginolyticus TaxID=59839 RepID=A0ABT4GMB2_9BACL|nr:TniQ family protein [Paenibacillus alginolyticus]MCY9697339.1 TniQ family protein [Paenibacillus alginolyticus]MEC0145242.1 TniQ family protein [Paenibacillus alginolyticus]